MGLAGRKNKQRIGTDPRNLTWSDDSSKFGTKYLQSLGWTSGSGLGPSGEGRTGNLKIHQKLDLMGIGANRRGADDASWKVGREFDGLLARLNQAQAADIPPAGDEASSEAVDEVAPGLAVDAQEARRGKGKEDNQKRKRKRSTEREDEDDTKTAKRRRKEEKKEQKEKKRVAKEAKKLKKKSRSSSEVEEGKAEVKEPVATPTPAEPVKVAPRYRAHRARNLASKRLAAASTTGMNEILGIAPGQTSSIPFPALMTPPKQHSANDGVKETRITDELPGGAADGEQTSTMGLGARSSFGGGLGFGMGKSNSTASATGDGLFRKSGTSVAEYFAEKMRMRNVK